MKWTKPHPSLCKPIMVIKDVTANAAAAMTGEAWCASNLEKKIADRQKTAEKEQMPGTRATQCFSLVNHLYLKNAALLQHFFALPNIYLSIQINHSTLVNTIINAIQAREKL